MTRKNERIDRERYLLLKGMLEDRRREIHEKLRSLRFKIAEEEGRVRRGDLLGMVAFGGGLTWGAAVVRWEAGA